jgi:hypothetical protein
MRDFAEKRQREGEMHLILVAFRIGEAFGRGEAFILLAEAEMIQSIQGFGEPKNENPHSTNLPTRSPVEEHSITGNALT